jgi:hypothetical protein
MDPDPDPYLWITDPDADPGGPKTSGSPTHCYQLFNEPRHFCFRDKKFKEELEKYKKTDAAV